jgi:hypothetical protein
LEAGANVLLHSMLRFAKPILWVYVL